MPKPDVAPNNIPGQAVGLLLTAIIGALLFEPHFSLHV